MSEHQIFNRRTGKMENEVSANTGGLTFLYNSLPGRILNPIMAMRFVSQAYSGYVRSKRSKSKISSFIGEYNIDVAEVIDPPESFKSLNDFFIRKLKPEARPIDTDASHLISPADSRLLVFDLLQQNVLPVKGYWYTLENFVRNAGLAGEFANGWCFVYRLAPCDYHRFCFIDNGRQENVVRIKGVLHSVNPIALSSVNSLMAKNYREMTILNTENFGRVLHFEVGALMVGKVVLHDRSAAGFTKGQEKGWFEFGGSTIVQFFKKEMITPDTDLLELSQKGIETLVRIGEKVGCTT
jgi:phosphatidylserine decarboxylase